MRILITGAAGFIGSHLSESLLEQGHEIAIIDDLNNSYRPELKGRNLALVRASGPVVFFPGDIRRPEIIKAAFTQFPPVAVIHLAARAEVLASLEDPLLYEQVSVGAAAAVVLLEACRHHNVKQFIFGSFSSVYGIATKVPLREDDPCLWPISPYLATKIAGERIASTCSHLYGMRVSCLRFFNVFGPRQRPDLAIRIADTLRCRPIIRRPPGQPG